MIQRASLATLAMATFSAAAAQQLLPPVQDDPSDIVVRGNPNAPARRLPGPIDYLRSTCFDPLRLTGYPAPPADDVDWEPLDDDQRQAFKIADSSAPAFSLADARRGLTLIIKFEAGDGKGNIHAERCTMAIIGPIAERALLDALSALYHGGGTQRHVGHKAGVPVIKGWHQWRWNGIPDRHKPAWRAFRAIKGVPSFVVVADLNYYQTADYVTLNLRSRLDGNVHVVELEYVTRKPLRPRPKD